MSLGTTPTMSKKPSKEGKKTDSKSKKKKEKEDVEPEADDESERPEDPPVKKKRFAFFKRKNNKTSDSKDETKDSDEKSTRTKEPTDNQSKATSKKSKDTKKKSKAAKGKDTKEKIEKSKDAKNKNGKAKKDSKKGSKKDASYDDFAQQELEEDRAQLEKEAKNKFKLALAAAENTEKALEFFEDARAAEEKLHGPISSQVAFICEKIGDTYKSAEDRLRAASSYERALNIFHILETGEKFETFEERNNMLEMRSRAKTNLSQITTSLSQGESGPFIPTEITLDENASTRVKKPPSRQMFNLLSDNSTTASMSTATSMFSDNWSHATPGSQFPLSKKKIHPKEEEKNGDIAEDEGDLGKAIEFYKTALSVMVRKRRQDNKSVLRLKIKIADTLLRDGKAYAAIKMYSNIANFLEAKRRDNVFFMKTMVPPHHGAKVTSEFLRDILSTEKKGDAEFKKGLNTNNFMDAATYYNRVLRALYKDKTLKPGNKHILRIHVKLGNIKWMMDDSGSIVKAYEKAVQYFERKGDTLEEKKDYSNAFYCYCQSLRFHFKIVKPDDPNILRVQVKIADILFHEGESMSALSLYRDVFNYISDGKADSFYQKVLTKTVVAHEDVGEGCILENNPKEALIHYQEILNLYRTGKWKEDDKSSRATKESKVLEKIGDVNIMMKNYDAAEAAYAESTGTRGASDSVALDPADSKSAAATQAASNHKLGYTYEQMENFDRAEEFYMKAISIRQELYGPLDGELAKYCYSHNSVKRKRGQVEEAFEGLTKVLDIFNHTESSNSIVSIEHVNTLKDMAQIYLKQGDKANAFQFFAKQLDKLQRCRSTTMKDVIEVLRNMANILKSIGNVRLALKYFEMELQMREKITHGNDDELADTHRNIGYCYAVLGFHSKSYEHYEQGIYDDAAAKENIMVYNKMGIQLAKMAKYEEALKIHQTSILYLHEGDDEMYMMTYNNLANAYQGIQDYDKAFQYFNMVPDGMKKKGSGADVLSFTKFNMGNLYQSQGLIEKAKECFKEYIAFVDAQEQENGENKESKAIKANALNNIGNILVNERKYDESTEFYKQALLIKKEVYGQESKEVFGTLCNLGHVFYKLQMSRLALNYLEAALEITTNSAAGQESKTGNLNQAMVLHKLANVYFMAKDYDQAMEYYRDAFVIKSHFYDDANDDLMLTRYNIGQVLLKEKDHMGALELFEDIYEKKKEKTGDEDPEVAKIKLDIAECQIAVDELDKAKSLCMEAMETFNEAGLSLRHPYIRRCKKLLGLTVEKFLTSGNILDFLTSKEA